MVQGRWYAWPSPPKSKRYVAPNRQDRNIPFNPSGANPKTRPERGFWAPVPGGKWKQGPRGMVWEYARKEPDSWKGPKKRLNFIKSPAVPREDKENASSNEQQPAARKLLGVLNNEQQPAAGAALKERAPGKVVDKAAPWAFGTQPGHNNRASLGQRAAPSNNPVQRAAKNYFGGNKAKPKLSLAGGLPPRPQAQAPGILSVRDAARQFEARAAASKQPAQQAAGFRRAAGVQPRRVSSAVTQLEQRQQLGGDEEGGLCVIS